MKILYHHRTQGRGAEGIHITGVVQALEALGHSVDLVSPFGVDPRQEAGWYLYEAATLKRAGVIRLLWRSLSRYAPQVIFELAELAYNALALLRLLRRPGRTSFELIYERYAFFLAAGTFFSRWMRVPLILEVNEVSGLARARAQVLIRLCRLIESYVFRAAHTIVVVSSFLKETLVARGVEPTKIVVVPNGVDDKKFHPDRNGEEVRRTWRFEERVLFGFVGWFDPWDELPFLIDVLEEVYRLRPQAALVLVGDVVGKGPGLDDLRAQILRRGLAGAVLLAGRVARKRMPETIAAIDIGVIPHSNVFGSPVALFEFMASGKPVIATALGPVQDVLTDGENGLLFRPKDRDAMKRAFLRLIDEPNVRTAIGAAARKSVVEHHSWESKAKRILAFHAGRDGRAS